MQLVLTDREQAYVTARVAGMTPTKAREAVGYHRNYSEVERKPEIKQAIAQQRKALKDAAAKKEEEGEPTSVKWLVRSIRRIAERCELIDDHGNALKALELLGKHLGAWERDNQQRAPIIFMGGMGSGELRSQLERATEERGRLIEHGEAVKDASDGVQDGKDGTLPGLRVVESSRDDDTR